jgi:hypothetical protein
MIKHGTGVRLGNDRGIESPHFKFSLRGVNFAAVMFLLIFAFSVRSAPAEELSADCTLSKQS